MFFYILGPNLDQLIEIVCSTSRVHRIGDRNDLSLFGLYRLQAILSALNSADSEDTDRLSIERSKEYIHSTKQDSFRTASTSLGHLDETFGNAKTVEGKMIVLVFYYVVDLFYGVFDLQNGLHLQLFRCLGVGLPQ